MKDTPVLTQELARQIEQVDIDYTTSRLGGMQAAEGNPLVLEAPGLIIRIGLASLLVELY